MPHYPLTFENLTSFCDRQSLRYKLNMELKQLALQYRLLDREAPLYIVTRPERSMVTLAMPLPFAVPAERLPFIGEAVTRLNSATFMGTWILNVETGEVYFRVTLPSRDAEYGDHCLLFVLRLVVSTVERAAKGLHQIAFGDATVQQVFYEY